MEIKTGQTPTEMRNYVLESRFSEGLEIHVASEDVPIYKNMDTAEGRE